MRSFNFSISLRHFKSFSILKSAQHSSFQRKPYEKRTQLLRFHMQKVEKIKEEIISINLFRLSQDLLNPSCCQNARAYLFGSSYHYKRAHAMIKKKKKPVRDIFGELRVGTISLTSAWFHKVSHTLDEAYTCTCKSGDAIWLEQREWEEKGIKGEFGDWVVKPSLLIPAACTICRCLRLSSYN